jgi:hypothetical protein
MRQLSRWMILLLLLLTASAVPAAARAAQAQEEPPGTSVRYEIRYMDLHAAEALAWEQCTKKDRCRVAALGLPGDPAKKAYLEVLADSATHERIARALVKADSMPRTQVFQVVLLSASGKAGAAAPELSPSAQKALSDLRNFLPYKSYEVLDTAWIRSTQDDLAEGRVVGLRGIPYRMQLRFRVTGAAEEGQLFLDGFRLTQEAGTPEPPGKEGSGPSFAPRPARDLISTSFGLKVGETIVVGASKVDGAEDALVVLLTAVPEAGRS